MRSPSRWRELRSKCIAGGNNLKKTLNVAGGTTGRRWSIFVHMLCLTAALTGVGSALAQDASPGTERTPGEAKVSAATESRDASTGYLGTANFNVGRIGRDCLALIGRTETPQAFVSVWQQRNMKYLMAAAKYLEARLAEAEATGGVERRNAVISELVAAVRSSAEASAKSRIDAPDKQAACKRVLQDIQAPQRSHTAAISGNSGCDAGLSR